MPRTGTSSRPRCHVNPGDQEGEGAVPTIKFRGDPRLRWFDLHKYERTSSLTDLGWYFQIETRRHIFYTLDACKEKIDGARVIELPDLLHRQVACLRQTPVATIQSIQARGLQLSTFWHLAIFLSQREAFGWVQRLRLNDVVDITERLLADAELARSGDHTSPIPSGFCDPAVRSRLADTAFAEREEWKYATCGQSRIDDGRVFPRTSSYLVQANLGASDALLKKQFAEILKQWRAEDTSEPADRALPELNWKPQRTKKSSARPWAITPRLLHNRRMLQFLDLTIFEEMNDCKISPSVKAQLIFGGSPRERIYFKGSTANQEKRSSMSKHAKHSRRSDNTIEIEHIMLSVESQCWSLMDMFDLADLKLTTRAEEELMKGYVSSKANPEFVPSSDLRLEVRSQLERQRN